MLGKSQGGACTMTLVERRTGRLIVGKLERRATADPNARLIAPVQRETKPISTITADNGKEVCGYKAPNSACRCSSTSRRRTTPGSAARTRTPTG